MKKTLPVMITGVTLGISGVFLFSKPAPAAPAEEASFIEYSIELPGDVLSLTHGFAGGIGPMPDAITTLENSTISDMLAFTGRIRDRDGNLVGLASELEIFPDANGIRPDMTWKTDWTVTTPQGTLFMHENERIPAAHLPAFETVAGGEAWTGSLPAQVSVGPHPSGRGVIVGGTGLYAGATGTFVEKVDLRGLTPEGDMAGVMYVQIFLDKKPGGE